jgi:rubrerythrin
LVCRLSYLILASDAIKSSFPQSPQLFGTAASNRASHLDLVSSPVFDGNLHDLQETPSFHPTNRKRSSLDSPLSTRKRQRVRVLIPKRRKWLDESPTLQTNESEKRISPAEVAGEVAGEAALFKEHDVEEIFKTIDVVEETIVFEDEDEEMSKTVKVVKETAAVEVGDLAIEADVKEKAEDQEDEDMAFAEERVEEPIVESVKARSRIGMNWRQPSKSNVLASIGVKSSKEIFEIMRKEIELV